MLLWCFLAVAVGAGGCAHRDRSPVAKATPTDYVGVAGITGDPELAKRLVGVLAEAGITSTFDGSIGYCIYVPTDKRAQAVAVLKEDADRHRHWIEFLPK